MYMRVTFTVRKVVAQVAQVAQTCATMYKLRKLRKFAQHVYISVLVGLVYTLVSIQLSSFLSIVTSRKLIRFSFSLSIVNWIFSSKVFNVSFTYSILVASMNENVSSTNRNHTSTSFFSFGMVLFSNLHINGGYIQDLTEPYASMGGG